MTVGKIPVAKLESRVKEALKDLCNGKDSLIDMASFERSFKENIGKKISDPKAAQKIYEGKEYKQVLKRYKQLTPEMYVYSMLDREFKSLNSNEITREEFDLLWGKVKKVLKEINEKGAISLSPEDLTHILSLGFFDKPASDLKSNKRLKKWLSI